LLRERKNNKKDRWSRHGLGHLLNPTGPESSDRNWTAAVWNLIVRKSLGLNAKSLAFADLPAIGRTTVSSPVLMKCFESLNAGKPYCDQIKPFNFLQTCHVSPFGHPACADPERFHLVSPYGPDPRKWLVNEWIDQYTGKRFRITTQGHRIKRDRQGQDVWRYRHGIRVPPGIQMRRWFRRSMQQTDNRVAAKTPRQNRSDQVHRQGVEQPGRSWRGLGPLRRQRLHRVRGPESK